LSHNSIRHRAPPKRRLEPFTDSIRSRYSAYQAAKSNIDKHEGGLAKFAEGYKDRGFQVDERNGVRYTEWAPGAVEARLIGDFSELREEEERCCQ
jgi:1,4-alpha-glucan branching enzyme